MLKISLFLFNKLELISLKLLTNAYFKRLRRKITSGKDSRNLCGPVDGRGANTPPNLSNIHAFGAAKRFKCFFGPRAYETGQREREKTFTHLG